MGKAHSKLPVSEIHQSSYNVDNLIRETINAIAAHIEADYEWDGKLQEMLETDLAIIDRWATDTMDVDLDTMPSDILEDWVRIGNGLGIVVIEDGEAGWTYVGYDSDEFIRNYWEGDDTP